MAWEETSREALVCDRMFGVRSCSRGKALLYKSKAAWFACWNFDCYTSRHLIMVCPASNMVVKDTFGRLERKGCEDEEVAAHDLGIGPTDTIEE
jgi:hypothetical protein